MKRFAEAIVWLLLMLCALYGLVWFMTLPAGCAAPAEGLGKGLGQGAMTAALDRLESKMSYMNEQQTPQMPPMSEGGMAAILAAMNGAFGVFYLIRKKWFNIEGRNVLVKKKKPKS